MWKIKAIVYNRKTADWMETGISSNIRPKRTENTPGVLDIRLKFKSVRPIMAKCP